MELTIEQKELLYLHQCLVELFRSFEQPVARYTEVQNSYNEDHREKVDRHFPDFVRMAITWDEYRCIILGIYTNDKVEPISRDGPLVSTYLVDGQPITLEILGSTLNGAIFHGRYYLAHKLRNLGYERFYKKDAWFKDKRIEPDLPFIHE